MLKFVLLALVTGCAFGPVKKVTLSDEIDLGQKQPLACAWFPLTGELQCLTFEELGRGLHDLKQKKGIPDAAIY